MKSESVRCGFRLPRQLICAAASEVWLFTAAWTKDIRAISDKKVNSLSLERGQPERQCELEAGQVWQKQEG